MTGDQSYTLQSLCVSDSLGHVTAGGLSLSPNCLGKQTGSFPLKVNENLQRANLIKVGETPAWGEAALCSQTQGELAVLPGAQRHLRDLFNPFTTWTGQGDGGHGADQIGFPDGEASGSAGEILFHTALGNQRVPQGFLCYCGYCVVKQDENIPSYIGRAVLR